MLPSRVLTTITTALDSAQPINAQEAVLLCWQELVKKSPDGKGRQQNGTRSEWPSK